ncbi:MAG: winged helix DNA-binding domain-containing protein, partial [Prevotellaceae bacterium]|nr:winged helix DNA-binding domain-containing protein [Prevotellaceae bacterium]
IAKALEGNNHLTREQLADALQRTGIAVDSARMNHFLMRAENEAIICSGALQGKKRTYALLDERVANIDASSLPQSREESLARLAYIYFTSHCPATLADFAWWSGLTAGDVRKGLNAVIQEFEVTEVEGQTYYFKHNTFSKRNAFETPLLLPAFDEYIIAYRDRRAAIATEQQVRAISSNGIFRPTIVINGIVTGLWRKTTFKRQPLAFEHFEPIDGEAQKAINRAGERFLKFQQN